MIEIGRLCVKIAGRDAGKKALIIDVLDEKFVLIDGETRRRRCNVIHIEPLNQVLKIEKDATHGDVARALKEIGIVAMHTKPKQKAKKPKKIRKTSAQLKEQKQEKKKLMDVFRPKKKEAKAETKETSLEEKAGLTEEKTETKETKSSKESADKKEKLKVAKKISGKKKK